MSASASAPKIDPNAKAYELRQRRATINDDMRVLCERTEKENRSFTPAEKEEFDAKEVESRALAERISNLERIDAVNRIGDEPRNRSSDPLPHEDRNNTRNGRHEYSILKGVRALASKGAEPLAGLELEVSQEIAKRSQKSPQGFFIPGGSSRGRRLLPRGRVSKRALDVATYGTASVPTILEADWIELLRNRMMVMQAGAREITDLVGKFAIPRQTAANTAYWVAEAGAPTGGQQTIDQVVFTPKTIGAFTDITRRFFELTVFSSGEEFVREDLTAILARGIDLAALNGTGASNQPTGILQNSTITTPNTVALGTNGGAPTWNAMVDMRTIVSRGNADFGALGYIGNADVRGTLQTTAKIGSTFPVFLMNDDEEVAGMPFYTTQQLPSNLTKGTGTNLSPLIYGNWEDLILAYWSGVDILVDPYTGSSSGTVRVVALQDLDIQIRHFQSFAVIVDMITNQ